MLLMISSGQAEDFNADKSVFEIAIINDGVKMEWTDSVWMAVFPFFIVLLLTVFAFAVR